MIKMQSAVLVVAELAVTTVHAVWHSVDGIEEPTKNTATTQKRQSLLPFRCRWCWTNQSDMAKFRNNAPKEWNATEITVVEDFSIKLHCRWWYCNSLTLQVMSWNTHFADGSDCRSPSCGTEPKSFTLPLLEKAIEDSQSKIANIGWTMPL